MPNSTTMVVSPSTSKGQLGRPADTPQSGAMPRSYQVTPVGPDPVIGTTALMPTKRRQLVSEPDHPDPGSQPTATAAELPTFLLRQVSGMVSQQSASGSRWARPVPAR
jgi:hypothetical protein